MVDTSVLGRVAFFLTAKRKLTFSLSKIVFPPTDGRNIPTVAIAVCGITGKARCTCQ